MTRFSKHLVHDQESSEKAIIFQWTTSFLIIGPFVLSCRWTIFAYGRTENCSIITTSYLPKSSSDIHVSILWDDYICQMCSLERSHILVGSVRWNWPRVSCERNLVRYADVLDRSLEHLFGKARRWCFVWCHWRRKCQTRMFITWEGICTKVSSSKNHLSAT